MLFSAPLPPSTLISTHRHYIFTNYNSLYASQLLINILQQLVNITSVNMFILKFKRCKIAKKQHLINIVINCNSLSDAICIYIVNVIVVYFLSSSSHFSFIRYVIPFLSLFAFSFSFFFYSRFYYVFFICRNLIIPYM